MKYFATSDTHFGHTNIIRYCERPFVSVAAMDIELIARWNQRVSVEDIVYFLGDFAMGPGATDDHVINVLEKLNGHKRFVLGNHDAPYKKQYSGLRLILQSKPLLGAVLESVHETEMDGTLFVMCHFPIETWHYKERGSVHLHGHVHTRFGQFNDHALPLRYDIGVDMYGGPVEITGDLSALNRPKGWA